MSTAPDICRILVPHDFNDAAERALTYAILLGQRFNGQVTVLHVYRRPSSGMHGATPVSYDFEQEIMRRSRIALDDVVARARAGKVEIDTLLREGAPAVEIAGIAEEINADLIVMGTEGRRGIARALLGSVAEHVVRTATVPVLTVRAHK